MILSSLASYHCLSAYMFFKSSVCLAIAYLFFAQDNTSIKRCIVDKHGITGGDLEVYGANAAVRNV